MLSAASTASPEQAQSSPIDQPLKDFSQADTPQGSLPLPDYNSISSSSVGSDAMQPAAVPDATQKLPPPPPPLDYNNISSNPFGSDAMQPVPAPAATPDAAAAVAPSPEEALQTPTMPLAQPPPPPPPPPTLQPPVAQNPIESSAISRGGKNRKKSKRSKKTIRKSDKTLNKVTKKQKINNADSGDSGDSKAKAQGLAQALLQSQGQS